MVYVIDGNAGAALRLIQIKALAHHSANIMLIRAEGFNMRVQDICTHHVAHMVATESLIETAVMMRERHVGNVVVVENLDGKRRPIGFLTDRDIIVSVIAAGFAFENLVVGDVMSKPVYCCGGTQSVFDAIAIMHEHGIRRLPVLDEEGGLAGIIAASDIWIALSNQLKILGEITERERVTEVERRT